MWYDEGEDVPVEIWDLGEVSKLGKRVGEG
jgi:hypothetical protein